MQPARNPVSEAFDMPSSELPDGHLIAALDQRDEVMATPWRVQQQWVTAIHDVSEMTTPTTMHTSGIRIIAIAPGSGPNGQTAIPAILGDAGMNRTMTMLRVLVVEDDALIGELLAEMLVDMGHDVCAVEMTEAGAVAAAIRCRPDLMIVDVQLGDGNGVDAVTTIHRSGPVPHVFVSGDISKVKLPWPSSVIIQKPYREADLARVIRRALDAPPALT
jgi:CheY-like chemotaxis protein